MKIIIGADLMPTKTNEHLFEEGNISKLFGVELSNLLKSADFRIFNLEGPLTNERTEIKKNGSNLRAKTNTIRGIKAIGVDLLTICNNHIMDQGEQGLESTINLLRNNKISFVGVGNTIEEAKKEFIFEQDGLKIGIYACVENEFSVASENCSGANPFDIIYSFDHVEQLKKKCDYVIVLYHGGKEHYRFPSPFLQKICRRFVEKGADIIISQHSHCIGCEEDWKSGKIVYGQGNFLFDNKEIECWKTGLLIELEILKEKASVKYIPVVKQENLVRLADSQMKEEILYDFKYRSKYIKDEKNLKIEYKKFALNEISKYEKAFLGKLSTNTLFRIVNKILKNKLSKLFFGEKEKLKLLNYIECEAHRELLIEGLKNI